MAFASKYQHLVRENEILAPYTWLQLGGPARYFAEPNSITDLQGLIEQASNNSMPIRLMGDGSNLLVRDEGIEALVLRLATAELCRVEVEGSKIFARAGAKLNHVISAAVGAGLGGLEHLAGIPGSIGAAVAGNAGVTNVDVGSRVTAVQVITPAGDSVRIPRSEMQFGFRRSNLQDGFISDIELTLDPGDAETLTRRMQSSWIIRRAAQPSSGSRTVQAVIEPDGINLADALDQSGLKGMREGEAVLNAQHAGFITVSGKATAKDVIALLEKVIRTVDSQAGIQLQSQLKIW